MVWRKVIICICCVMLLAASGSTAYATDTTPEPLSYNYIYEITAPIPENVLYLAKSYVNKIGVNDDYVLFATDFGGTQTYYALVVGDATYDFDSKSFTFSRATGYIFTEVPAVGFVCEYLVASPGLYLIENDLGVLLYSNLGPYPELTERIDVYAFTALLMLGTALCCYLLRSIFGFCLRRRS